MKVTLFKRFVRITIVVLVFGYGVKGILAQEIPSALYVPLIGISSVPEPLALPKGSGDVTYRYAVKNFLQEYPLTDVQVTDDKCSPIKFIEGDDNGDGKLDYAETWRYDCVIRLYETTQSIATVIGTANNLPTAHKAYVTVVVGSDNPFPLVNIINVSKISYPLSLPIEGGEVTFTYRVNNPGVVPLSNISVTDDKCSNMSGKLGDTNYNNLLDITEVWIYTCRTHLTQTTTNTVSITAFAGELRAVGYATMTVVVEPSTPNFPETGARLNFKIIAWSTLLGILAGLVTFSTLTRKSKLGKNL